MAFSFFRRRQKLVIIIMVMLMIAFLIPSAFQRMTTRDPSDADFARSDVGDIKYGDVIRARTDLEVLTQRMGLANPQRMMQAGAIRADRLLLTMMLQSEGGNPQVSYAALQKEADAADILVTDGEVDAFFGQIGLGPGSAGYNEILSRMRSEGLGETQLRGAVRRWLAVQKNYTRNLVTTPPSAQSLRADFRDMEEAISLDLLRIDPNQFLSKVREPTEEQIEAHFRQFRRFRPGTFQDATSFGFGYAQPSRAKIQYLLVDRGVVARVTEPSESAVREQYLADPSRYTEQPATDAATQPDAEVGKTLSYSAAKPLIVEELREREVQRKMDAIESRIESLLERHEQEAITEAPPFQWVRNQMVRPADPVLSREIPVLDIRAQRLDDAMESLAEAAGIEAICYPTGKTAQGELDPAVRVTITGRGKTLREALAEVNRQLDWPELTWGMCDGFERTIFPQDPNADLFPVQVGQSEWLAAQKMLQHDLLGLVTTQTGQPLAQLVFTSAPFAPEDRGGLDVGQVGPVLRSLAANASGRFFWRIAEARPAHVPEQLTPAIREQVVADIKRSQAWQIALQQAEGLQGTARSFGLERAAEAAELEIENTGLFPRKTPVTGQQMIIQQLQNNQITMQQAQVQMQLLGNIVQLQWAGIPGVAVPTQAMQVETIRKAFELAPRNVEPATAPATQPYPASEVAMLNIPAIGDVILMRRADYSPPVLSEFVQGGRMGLLRMHAVQQRWLATQGWFNFNSIVRRLGIELENSERPA
jgi:hypothetical protein